MASKESEIERTSQDIIRTLQNIVPTAAEEILEAMRRCMDPQELQMFDLALFCEQEAIRAQESQAHFAACLMGAAMNEALLALMCLKYEAEVIATRQYKHSTRKRRRSFRDVIAEWSFEQFITVAEENMWIPAQIVSEDIKMALAEGFRELIPITHPEMQGEDIERGVQSFFTHPGTAMLRMCQDLRNAVHEGNGCEAEGPSLQNISLSGVTSQRC